MDKANTYDRFKLSISYTQFYLEPEHVDPKPYFEDTRDSNQEFSSFPLQAAIGTPNETASCEVEIELRSEMPELEDAVQAVCFPLSVNEPGKLFLRTVFEEDEQENNNFTVSPGKYDVFVRFFSMEAAPEAAEVGLRAWRVVVSFLAYGTIKPGTYRREYGEIPENVIVHD